MTWAQNGLVQSVDYNLMVTGDASGTANTANAALNTFWAVGNQNKGYGHAVTPAVAVGDTVIAASKWNTLVVGTQNAAAHCGSTFNSVTIPTAGSTVAYLGNLMTNISNVFTSRLNATTQGTTTANTATMATTWLNAITATHTVTFASGDAARYFFNAGGQLAVTVSHPSGTGIDLLLNNLASNVGTVVLSSPTTGTVTIASTAYNGITKVGGGGNAPTTLPNNGYFALTTTNAAVFTQTASTGPAGYLSTSIDVAIKSNGTQGANGDAGSVITIYTTWDEIPNGLSVSAGSATTVTIRPPETTNISNNWGAITLAGVVSGT